MVEHSLVQHSFFTTFTLKTKKRVMNWVTFCLLGYITIFRSSHITCHIKNIISLIQKFSTSQGRYKIHCYESSFRLIGKFLMLISLILSLSTNTKFVITYEIKLWKDVSHAFMLYVVLKGRKTFCFVLLFPLSYRIKISQ